MRLRKIQIIFLVTIAITFALTPVREAEAEDISTATQETESVQPATGGSITSGTAVDVTSPGSVTTGPAVTTPGSIEGEKEPLIEVLDEFDAGGISYMVTEIKDGKVYVEVTGVINDRATTVYIPKKTEYNKTEMIVSSIGEDSFSYLERLRKVVVAADITHIAKDAFKGAEKFSRLVIKTSALNKVEKNIFKDVSSKFVVEVPKKKLTSYKKLFNNKGAKIKEIRAIKNRL